MKKRLLIRPGAIGDFIVSLPALESLTLPGQYTEIWCAEQNVPLARFADRVRSIGSTGLDRLGVTHADDVIGRLGEFDEIISWYGENRPEFRELAAELALPFRFLRALPDGRCHAADFYAAQARGSGGTPAGYPRIVCPETQRTFAAIHPFASSEAKRAPMEFFKAAAEKLKREMPVHWICGPEEDLPDAVRIPGLYDLACWLQGANLYRQRFRNIPPRRSSGNPGSSVLPGKRPAHLGTTRIGCECNPPIVKPEVAGIRTENNWHWPRASDRQPSCR